MQRSKTQRLPSIQVNAAMKTILFPTDFSERASNALNQALVFIQNFDAKIIIYHAYHRPAYYSGGKEQLDQKLDEVKSSIDLKFKQLLKNNEALKETKYEFRKALGVSVESIVELSKKEIDLIIMATKGTDGLGELWGTKTAKIIKSVEVPVLVIPDNTSLTGIKKMGLACDYSQYTEYETLDFLLEVTERLKLDVDTITLNRSEKVMTNKEKDYKKLVREKLETVPATFNFTFHNNVDEGIINYAKANDIGLIAMLPKSYSFMESLFHESLTEQMTFHSPIPLLVLK